MNYGREIGGGAGVIPTRFVWPYGGRNVYICGSFNGWAPHIMTPIEGCPTVFQTVCGLTPGHHQYKFIVDDELRHDEHQPYENGHFGIVNTVYLAGESTQMPSGSNMDVDNESLQSGIRILNGPMHESTPRVPEADLVVSRQRILSLLSSKVAYELLPESGKVIVVDVGLPVKQAFHIMHEQGIPMAPLWDAYKGRFVGVLSASDFILIIKELGSNGSNLTEEQLDTHTISAWKEAKLYLNRGFDLNESFTRQLVQAGPDDNLKDLALKILQNNVSQVPIIVDPPPSDESLYPQLLHLASLSGVLKCICRYFRNTSNSLPILQYPVSAFPLGSWVQRAGEPNQRPLAILRGSASLGSALSLLIQAQVSAIPIVDDNESLVDIYSRSDITALAKDRVYTHINLEEMTVNQALMLSQDLNAPNGYNNQRCNMCLRSDPLYKVMERLSIPGVRRLIVVEAGSKRVEGIITLSDVVKFLLS